MTSTYSIFSRSAVGVRKAIWTTRSRRAGRPRPGRSSRPFGYGERIAVAEDDAGRDDLVADVHPRRRVDVAHAERAAELAGHVAGRPAVLDQAGDRGLGSLMRVTSAVVGPTSETRPASAPPAAMTTSPTARPSSVPRSMRRRRAGISGGSRAMTSRRDRSEVGARSSPRGAPAAGRSRPGTPGAGCSRCAAAPAPRAGPGCPGAGTASR